MIHFSLICDSAHEFEAWFRNSEDFNSQNERGLVSCPFCHSIKVEKALMAPAVSTARRKESDVALAMTDEQKKLMSQLQELSRQVRENAEYVGDRFAEEARKIHFGETEARGIYGEATGEEARSLLDEGVEFIPLPALPGDRN